MVENLKQIQSVLNVFDRFFGDFVFVFIFAMKILADKSLGDLFLTDLNGIPLMNPLEFLIEDRPVSGMSDVFKCFLHAGTNEVNVDGPE